LLRYPYEVRDSDLPTGDKVERPRVSRAKVKFSAPKISEKRASEAAVDLREAERLRELAEVAKKRERRDRAVAKAQAALDKAEREHHVRTGDIEAELEPSRSGLRARRLAGRRS
jgi:colicin import membrane protein